MKLLFNRSWVWGVVLVLILPGRVLSDSTNSFYQSAGTKRMAERLTRISRESDPLTQPFLNRQRAKIFYSLLEQERRAPSAGHDVRKLFDLQAQYGLELLNSGQTEQAIEEISRFISLLKETRAYGPQNRVLLRNWLATSYLRLGEQQNCLMNHTKDSCLAPIRGGGIHKLQQGSRDALKVLNEELTEFPQDLRARWLLNIACMTLGEYPDKVPPIWLIPPKAFDSDYNIKRFYDVSADVGLELDTLAGSVVMDDFDGDGNLDLMISALDLNSQVRFFHNNGDGTFTERTKEAGLVGEMGGLNMIQTDYNNDGHLDLLILRGAWQGVAGHEPLSLLRNNGNGTFDDVTEETGLLRFHPTQTAAWFDFNNDGWLDLFIGNETTPGDTNICELYRNNGDGTFTECAAEVGLNISAYVKAVASGDYNNDGWPDLYISSRDQPKMLFRNEGPQSPDKSPKGKWKFTEVAAAAGVSEPLHSFPTWFFDYDNDGWLDIFVCGYAVRDVGDVAADYLGLPSQAERPRLYHNNHDGTFTDVTRQAHLDKVLIAMAGNFGDLDNDGFLDFYLGTGDPDLSMLVPNRMFRNADGKVFQDVTTSGGFGHLQKGHGIAFGDIDNDGDQDIYEAMGGALEGDHYHHMLYENPGHGNHWVTLKLEGTQSNRAAVGARIKVVVRTNQGERNIYKTVSTGGSFGGSPLRQEIGLGQAQSIQRTEIFWPTTGKTQVIKDLSMDHFYKIREGDLAALPLKLKSFKLAGTPGERGHEHHHHSP
jgi:hypothetical protein